ncbi:MAG: hypothetical protein LAO51_07130 [Acidobacteriia bacterium]|nr:hypothetical protein [Terriglobia bacterium]
MSAADREGMMRRIVFWLNCLPPDQFTLAALAVAALVQDTLAQQDPAHDSAELAALRAELATLVPSRGEPN